MGFEACNICILDKCGELGTSLDLKVSMFLLCIFRFLFCCFAILDFVSISAIFCSQWIEIYGFRILDLRKCEGCHFEI